VTPTIDGSTQDILEALEGVDFRVVLGEPGAIVLRTTLRYDLHVRPATYLYGRLRDAGFIDQLSLRRSGSGDWVDLQPLSLVAMALRRHEEIDIRVATPVTREMVVLVMDAFRSCPLYRDYSDRLERMTGEPTPAGPSTDFQKEFESCDAAYSLIRLDIENFIIGHLAEIESYILQNSTPALTDWDCIHAHFKSLLFGEFEHFGIMSLDVPLDNLMQTRDMCYHLHFEQIEKGRKLSYTLMGIEWGRENAFLWRRNQTRRHRYFYERESAYYRDLFLVLVLREQGRLSQFVRQHAARLDYSLQLRRELPMMMRRVEVEMENFSPNFANPEEFRNHIHLMGELVIRDLSRLTPYVQLIRDQRIYHTPKPS
jgi:hypothetical protein